jgi:NADH-quinone oxidoreductase subunit C
MTTRDIIDALGTVVQDVSLQAVSASDEAINPTVLVPLDRLVDTCVALRDTPGLEFVAFSDVTAADFHPSRTPRFDVVYHLVSPHRRARVRLKVHVADGQAVPSVTAIWPGAGWPEREVYDLFGIVFDHHPDLRRLMMPDDWDGHPLRKDYPVQVQKEAQTFMPLQLTEEEFKANMERDRRFRPTPR